MGETSRSSPSNCMRAQIFLNGRFVVVFVAFRLVFPYFCLWWWWLLASRITGTCNRFPVYAVEFCLWEVSPLYFRRGSSGKIVTYVFFLTDRSIWNYISQKLMLQITFSFNRCMLKCNILCSSFPGTHLTLISDRLKCKWGGIVFLLFAISCSLNH